VRAAIPGGADRLGGIDLCKLGTRLLMSPEAVEKKFRRLLNIGDCAPWPPIVGHWENGRFVVCDGRHDYLAALMGATGYSFAG